MDRIVSSLPESTRNKLVPSNVLTLVQISLTPGLSEKVQKTVLANVQSVVETSLMPPPGVKVEISGSPAFSQQMSEGLIEQHGDPHWRGAHPDGHHDGDPLLLCPLPLHAGPARGDRSRHLPWPDGHCRYPAEHGGDRGVPGPDRPWDRLCDPVPCPVRRGGPEGVTRGCGLHDRDPDRSCRPVRDACDQHGISGDVCLVSSR